MNLYLISQNVNNNYDTYDSAVVCATTPEDAKHMHPDEGLEQWNGLANYEWVATEDVKVVWIGTAGDDIKRGVIIASFNAG